MKNEILKIINEANFEKDLHFVICDTVIAKQAITDFMCEWCGDAKYNPLTLLPQYKYGLLLFVIEATDEGQRLWENALYYANKNSEIYSGIVIFCDKNIVVFNHTVWKQHNLFNSTF